MPSLEDRPRLRKDLQPAIEALEDLADQRPGYMQAIPFSSIQVWLDEHGYDRCGEYRLKLFGLITIADRAQRRLLMEKFERERNKEDNDDDKKIIPPSGD